MANLITIHEAKRRYGIHRSTINRYLASGILMRWPKTTLPSGQCSTQVDEDHLIQVHFANREKVPKIKMFYMNCIRVGLDPLKVLRRLLYSGFPNKEKQQLEIDVDVLHAAMTLSYDLDSRFLHHLSGRFLHHNTFPCHLSLLFARTAKDRAELFLKIPPPSLEEVSSELLKFQIFFEEGENEDQDGQKWVLTINLLDGVPMHVKRMPGSPARFKQTIWPIRIKPGGTTALILERIKLLRLEYPEHLRNIEEFIKGSAIHLPMADGQLRTSDPLFHQDLGSLIKQISEATSIPKERLNLYAKHLIRLHHRNRWRSARGRKIARAVFNAIFGVSRSVRRKRSF